MKVEELRITYGFWNRIKILFGVPIKVFFHDFNIIKKYEDRKGDFHIHVSEKKEGAK